jgi:hypothetical protein
MVYVLLVNKVSACCFVWVENLVYHTETGTDAKGFRE